MSLGKKVAGAVPDSVYELVHQHPRVIYLATVPLLAFAIYNMLVASELQTRAEMFVADRLGEIQKAASEALGG